MRWIFHFEYSFKDKKQLFLFLTSHEKKETGNQVKPRKTLLSHKRPKPKPDRNKETKQKLTTPY